MIEFCDYSFPFPIPVIVVTNNDLWLEKVFIVDVIKVLTKPEYQDEETIPIGLTDIELAEIEIEVPIIPMFNIAGECSLRYREDTDRLAKDIQMNYGWQGALIDNGAFSLHKYGACSWVPDDVILRLHHQLTLAKKINANYITLIAPDFVQQPIKSIQSYVICLNHLKKTQQIIQKNLYPKTIKRVYLSAQGKSLNEISANINVLKDLFFSQSKKYFFQLGLALATREYAPSDAKTIIKEATDLFLYSKNPAWIHLLGESRQDILKYAQQLGKVIYDTTGDHRRTIVSADTSVSFFNAKEQIGDLRPRIVAEQYCSFWQKTNHDLKIAYSVDKNNKIQENHLAEFGYITESTDLFS